MMKKITDIHGCFKHTLIEMSIIKYKQMKNIITLSIFLLVSTIAYCQSGNIAISVGLQYNKYWVCDFDKYGELYMRYLDSNDYYRLGKLDIDNKQNIYIDSGMLKNKIYDIILTYKDYTLVFDYYPYFFNNENHTLIFHIVKLYDYKKYIWKSYRKQLKKGRGWDFDISCNGLKDDSLVTVKDRSYRQSVNKSFKDVYHKVFFFLRRTGGFIAVTSSKDFTGYGTTEYYGKYRSFF
jgi:hypothetical protein